MESGERSPQPASLASLEGARRGEGWAAGASGHSAVQRASGPGSQRVHPLQEPGVSMEWSCLVACSVYGHGPGAARGKQGSGNSRVPQSQQLCPFLSAMVTEMPGSHCLQVWSRPSPWQRASRARLTPRLLGLCLKAGELPSAKG